MQAKTYYIIILFCIFIFPLKTSPAQEQGATGADKEIREVGDRKVLIESYTVKHGDHLWQLLRDRGLLERSDFKELLAMLKRLNQSLPSLSEIEPGDKLIIPLNITSKEEPSVTPAKTSDGTILPESSKKPDPQDRAVKEGEGPVETSIKEPLRSLPTRKASKWKIEWMRRQLGEIFIQMGEEWVETGQHFIPLSSGGAVNLKADSYPIINLSNGNRVIVDLKHDLPEKMGHLITSSWENYRIVSLTETDDLRSALAKILAVCDYKKIYKNGEPFVTGEDISLFITADWIIKPMNGLPFESEKVIVITFMDGPASKTPQEIKNYLKSLGILAIDHPPTERPTEASKEKVIVLSTGQDRSKLIEMALDLSGQSFSKKMEIPIYRNQKTDFNLIIKADFLFDKNGREYIIDLTGLGPDIVSLLRQHQFSVLSMPDERDPSLYLPMVLDFMGIESSSGPHSFWTADRDESKNIRITMRGISFRDHLDQKIFATPIRLPEEIVNFLSRKGYKILGLSLSSDSTPY